MKAFILRAAVVGGLLAVTAGFAQPPAVRPPTVADAKKLKDDLEALRADREKATKEAQSDAGDAAERMKLRLDLLKKIEQLGNRPAATLPEVPPKPKEVPTAKGTKPETKPDFLEGSVPLDPLRVAQNLYKAGDVEAAYRAIKMIKTENLSPDDLAFSHYLTACCLRRQGKLSEATAVYREIADGKADNFLAESALIQLAEIRKLQELEAQLEQLRAKRKLK